ncbi:hypothetical protein CGCF413_v008118 [Colletotrichum fructicola]|nr:hypothetical protein CGCF413_v008118 [Colletotrichum fructicola]
MVFQVPLPKGSHPTTVKMQFSKVLCVLFPVAVLAAPLQTFNIPTMDPNTVAPEVPAIGKRVPQAEDTCTDE